jgi:hypothetical protein
MRSLAIMGLVGALLLSACGGDTLSGTSSSTSTATTPTANSMVTGVNMLTSSPQIASDGTGPATITALVHDANNNTVPGATVTFAASSGLLAVTTATTDANGAATATLSAGADPTNRTITTTATIGTSTASVAVNVIGSTLTVTGPQALVEPGSGTFTVTLHNSAGAGISGKAVAVSSTTGNTLSASTLTTDVNGQATFTVTAAAGGADTIKATALGLSGSAPLSVSTQSFVISSPAASANINLGVVTPVMVTWTNSGAPIAGQTIEFATTRGTLSAPSAITNSAGQAMVNLTSTTSGAATVTASGSGVSTQVNVDFIATTASALDLQASPSTISVSAQSTITAVVRDSQNNLVEGKLVTFSLSDVTGGTLSLASATTNSQGLAQTIYTASSTTSATNGIVVTATVQGTTITADTSLTVAGQTVFLSLGTGNTVAPVNATQYALPFSILAVDGAGNSVPGVTINIQVVSVNYLEGDQQYNGTNWAPVNTTSCGSEDANAAGGNANYNGILDPGEDFNGDGKLEPGSVAAASPGSVVTSTAANATASSPMGTAQFNIIYPKDHANWVQIAVVATATVAGTEASTGSNFVLPGLASDYTSATVAPPGPISPYGVSGACKAPIASPFFLTNY